MAQAAALAAVSGDLAAVARMREAFDRRRQLMTAMLNEIPGVLCPLPEGAFYCYPSVKGVLGRQIAGRRPASTAELAELILDEADVAVVPGEAFGTPGYFRLSYALGDADLEEGITRIAKLLAGTLHGTLTTAATGQAGQAASDCADGTAARRAAEGAPAPALHSARCGTRRWSSWPPSTGSACRRRWPRTGRRGCAAPTSAAGSGSSGCTTSPGRCCGRRPTCGGCCWRRRRTSGPRAPAGWRSRWTRPGTRSGSAASPRWWSWCSAAAAEAAAATGTGIGVIVAANRTKHPLEARTLARLASRYAGRGVIGFGLSSDERRGAAADFAPAFRIAARAGLMAVPHGGELAGPASVRACLDELHADRIGHGVAAARDAQLVRRLAARQTTLEVCPASNVALGVAATPADVPLRRLLDAGVRIALGADDPLLFGSRLVEQYALARQAHGLGDAELAELARMSVRASAAPGDVRSRLLTGIDDWLAAPDPDPAGPAGPAGQARQPGQAAAGAR